MVNSKVSHRPEIAALRDSFRTHRLMLVLGAGVSRPFGIPDWPTFLRRVVEAMHPETDVRDYLDASNTHPLILARYIRSNIKDRSLFNQLLHDNLYKYYKDESSDQTLKSIVKFLEKAIRNDQRARVLTYNFDCILERFLDKFAIGLRYSSTDFASEWDGAPIEIFHCHGKLPFECKDALASTLVFDESEYHTIYYDQYNRSNVCQVSCFMEQVCLFVGCSLSDPNTRRLLDYAAKNKPRKDPHHVFRLRPDQYTNLSGTALDEVINIYETDAESLGCSTIWIRDFSEIGAIISAASAL